MDKLEVVRDIFRELADLADELILMEAREANGEKISKEELEKILIKILHKQSQVDCMDKILG